MNIQQFFHPVLAMRMYKEQKISQSRITVYKWITIFSVYVYFISVIFQPTSSLLYDPLFFILSATLYGMPFLLYKKIGMTKEDFIHCYVILQVVSLVNMFLVTLVFMILGMLVFLPQGDDSYVYLQIVEIIALGIGISTVLLGFLYWKKEETGKSH